tara:strand:- start:2147 stop:2287 length:141 start_codon:yes stop_codon:yes gene_type:complete
MVFADSFPILLESNNSPLSLQNIAVANNFNNTQNKAGFIVTVLNNM